MCCCAGRCARPVADCWVYGDLIAPHKRHVAAVGFDRDDMTLSPITYDEMRPGCYDITERINDMNANGVLETTDLVSSGGVNGYASGVQSTIGITPTEPAVWFGYIECGETLLPSEGAAPAALRARRFVEKPPLARFCSSERLVLFRYGRRYP